MTAINPLRLTPPRLESGCFLIILWSMIVLSSWALSYRTERVVVTIAQEVIDSAPRCLLLTAYSRRGRGLDNRARLRPVDCSSPYFLSDFGRNPIGFIFGAGVISWRMASKTTLNCRSYLSSSSLSFLASSALDDWSRRRRALHKKWRSFSPP